MARPLPLKVEQLIHNQQGIVRRGQLIETGMTPSAIHRHLVGGKWRRLGEGVYATFTGPLTREAKLWTVVLLAGDGALLSYETAAELHGFAEETSQKIHVSVPVARDPARTFRMRGVVIHRCSVMRPDRIQAPWMQPRTGVESTTVDLIAAAETFDDAYAWVCRATKDNLTTPVLLRKEIAGRSRMRWRTWLTEALLDAGSGVNSALERRYLRNVERAHDLPTPERQARQHADAKTMYLDNLYAEYQLCVELDGVKYHQNRWQDTDRDNVNIAAANTRTMRFGWVAATEMRCRTAQLVANALRNNGWQGKPRPCKRGCPVTLPGVGDGGGAYGGVGGFVDQDEAAGGAVAGVGVAEDGLGQAEADPADLVQAEGRGRLVAVQGVHVQPVVQVGDDRLHGARGVLDDQP
jgi:hypothetical protein